MLTRGADPYSNSAIAPVARRTAEQYYQVMIIRCKYKPPLHERLDTAGFSRKSERSTPLVGASISPPVILGAMFGGRTHRLSALNIAQHCGPMASRDKLR